MITVVIYVKSGAQLETNEIVNSSAKQEKN